MKSIFAHAMLAALAVSASAYGQTEAKTTPVGYVKLGNNGTIPTGSDTYISLPLERTAEFAGNASQAATASSVTLSGAAFIVNQWQDDADTPPYILKVESGTKSGLVALIASNTANSLTVAPGFSLSGVAANDKITIRKAWTVKSLFEGVVLPSSGLQLFAYDGTETGVNTQPNNCWVWDGANWTNNTTLDVADDAVLYPGEALMVRNRSGVAISALTVSGEVALANSMVDIRGGVQKQDNPFSFVSSADESIISSGVTSVAAVGDTILVIPNDLIAINKSASKTYTYDGVAWMDNTTLDYVDSSVKFEAGKSYVYRRAAGAASVSWVNAPDYAASLSN